MAMKTKIPQFITCMPSDNGHDDRDPNEWAWVVLHEIDLYEEGEDSDIKSPSQYNQAKKCLAKLRNESTQ